MSVSPSVDEVLLADATAENAQIWMRFQAVDMSPERLKVIRAVAYLAMANGNLVKLWAKTDNQWSCRNLTQINILWNNPDTNT